MKNPSRFAFGSLVFSGLLGLMLLLPMGTASATPTTFNVSGTATNDSTGSFGTCAGGATCSFSGTLLIDTTSGTVTGVGITFPGFLAFNHLNGSSAQGNTDYWAIQAYNNTGADFLVLRFTTSYTPGSLVGFSGGSIVGNEVVSDYGAGAGYSSFAGSITPATVAVPEPGSLWMMLLGLGAMIFFVTWTRIRSTRQRALDAG